MTPLRHGILALPLAGCAAPAPAPVTFWLGGDVFLDGSRPILSPALAEALPGFGVVNLEGTLGAGGAQPGPPLRLTHAPDALDALADAGIRAASLANNHAADGDARATVDALADRGVAAFGGLAGAGRVDGVVFLAWELAAEVPSDVASAVRAAGDPVVVALHVTGPPDPLPSPLLREAAEVALGAGADLVVAHGTHGFGPIERRGDAVVAWGLGNLAFDCDCTSQRDAIVLAVTLDPAASGADRVRARAVPIRAGLGGAPAAPVGGDAILDVMNALGDDLGPDGAL